MPVLDRVMTVENSVWGMWYQEENSFRIMLHKSVNGTPVLLTNW